MWPFLGGNCVCGPLKLKSGQLKYFFDCPGKILKTFSGQSVVMWPS